MECSVFQKCNAPLCPEKNNDDIWYPEESICTTMSPTWVKVQRKIAKKTKSLNTFYTLKMLKQNCRIGSGMKGIDPDKDIEAQEIIWFKKHPVKKELSAENRKIIAERMAKNTRKSPKN